MVNAKLCIQVDDSSSIDLSTPPFSFVEYSLCAGNGQESAPASQVVHQERPRSVTLAHASEKTSAGLQIRTHQAACRAWEVETNIQCRRCVCVSLCVCVYTEQGRVTCRTHSLDGWGSAAVGQSDWLTAVTSDWWDGEDRPCRGHGVIAMATVKMKIKVQEEDGSCCKRARLIMRGFLQALLWIIAGLKTFLVFY